MNIKKLFGLVAARKAFDLLPSRRRTPLQRATDPENLTKVAAVEELGRQLADGASNGDATPTSDEGS